MDKSRIIIKKYENRRLYDTSASRYVNLDEIARMIRQGGEVTVLDAKTGEDLTRVILTQIIVEDARGAETGLPLELLRQMVVASDRATREFLSAYLETTLETYRKSEEAFRLRLSEAQAAAANPFEFIQRLFPAPVWPPRPETAELEELRRRVRELEERLEEKGEARNQKARSKNQK